MTSRIWVMAICLALLCFRASKVAWAGDGPAAQASDWTPFLAGLAVETAVVLPSNPYVGRVSFPRYAAGVLAAAAATFVVAKRGQTGKVTFGHALQGAAVGGALGGFVIFLAKKSEFFTHPEKQTESFVSIDPAPWNALVYAVVLVVPPLGASLGLRHHTQGALIDVRGHSVVLSVPEFRPVRERGAVRMGRVSLSYRLTVLRIHLPGTR